MPRFLAFSLLFAALVIPGIARADDVPSPADVAPSFEQLVREGDRARLAERNSDAARAYARALKLRNDPRIAGRLGLVALAGDAYPQAAVYLLQAITDGHTIPARERQQIKDAFDRARPLVSRIGISISHLGASVTIDGKPESLAESATSFYVFRAPGPHEIRATLEGYSDAVVNIETKKGDTVEVSLVLNPLPVPLNETPPEPISAPKCEPCKACEQKEDWSSLEELKPKPSPKQIEDAENKRVFGQWMPGIGATVIYGAVSPYPAVGAVVSSYWKWNSIVSVGFDFRAAMSQRGIEGYAIIGSNFALLPGFCVMRARFSGCLTIHGGIMWHSSNNPEVSTVRPSWGGGVNLGFTFARSKSIDFRVTPFGELLLSDYPLLAGRLDQVLWTGPPFITGLSLTAVLNR